MPTYVSMLSWRGAPPPSAAEIRAAMDERARELRRRGLRSLLLLPDGGDCAAVMVARCPRETAVSRLARAILPASEVRVDSMLFDEDTRRPENSPEQIAPPPSTGLSRRLLDVIVGDA